MIIGISGGNNGVSFWGIQRIVSGNTWLRYEA